MSKIDKSSMVVWGYVTSYGMAVTDCSQEAGRWREMFRKVGKQLPARFRLMALDRRGEAEIALARKSLRDRRKGAK